MKQAKALVLTGYGLNTEYEMAHSFALAGADNRIAHFSDLLKKNVTLDNFHVLTIPGGFSFGDDIATGKVFVNKLRYNKHLQEALLQFIEDGKLVFGACNGFQIIAKLGLLPAFGKNYFEQTATITGNDSGRFENRWVHLRANKRSHCVFTKGIERLYLVVRHGEGKFIPADDNTRRKLHSDGHVAVQYTDEHGNLAGYPHNPNGAIDNIAGICDETGRVFGMMPHAEAFNHPTNHPRWTRGEATGAEGLQIFRNAVEYVTEKLL